jgi:N-acetylglucosamine-6-phosphate deacetylase
LRKVPGLVDIHVHGLHGYDVMAGQGNEVLADMRALGIEWCLPTTVTADPVSIQSAIAAIDTREPGFAGVHLEGPFIDMGHGGAQPKEQIRNRPSVQDFFDVVGEYAELIRIVTLAPELPGAQELIGHLIAADITVSAGHTNATFEQLAAMDGIAHMTHCYNAMRPFHHRDAGAVGFALLSDAYCELIYDRVHTSKEAARLLFELKRDKVIAISDGTAAAGMADGWRGEMWGQSVVKADGAVRLENGDLAGSAATLADVFKNLWADFGAEIAIGACSATPRRALGLPEPEMWLMVDDDGTIIEVLE